MARTLTTVTRKLGMYYQKNGDGPAVAPTFDNPSIDIDGETKGDYLNYVTKITLETNRYPVSPQQPPATLQEYGTNFQNITTQDTQQQLRQPDLASSVAPVDQNAAWFPSAFVTPDKLGVYESEIVKRPRAFNVSTYMEAPIPANQGDSPIDKAILNATGYNETHKFIPRNILTLGDNPDRTLKLGSTGFQNIGLSGTGSHVGQQGNSSPQRTQLTIEDMQKVGLNLLFDAVQGEAGLDFTLDSESDFTEAEARTAIPSLPRIGKKTNLSRFTAANTLKKIKGNNYNPSGVTNFYDNTNDVQTNGSFYSPYNQFDSLISLGQIALAIAMILALVIVLDLVVLFVPNPDKTRDEERSGAEFTDQFKGNNSRYLGVSKVQGESGGYYPNNVVSGLEFVTQFFGIDGLFAPNYHPFDDCLQAGIVEFFGFTFGTQGRNVSSASTTALRILLESGRMTTILREVLRSGISVVEGGIADFSGGFSIASLGKLIRKIRDLKIIKFIDVLQQIGDKVLFQKDIEIENIYNFSGSSPSYVDSLSNDRSNYIAKSRLSNGTLAWGTSTAGILSLPVFQNQDIASLTNFAFSLNAPINSDHLYGNANLTETNPYANLSEWGNGTETATSNRERAVRDGRIPSDIVALYEKQLEKDYMPFYIHDLRTNEILPFHAFLEDVGEDFQIEYTSVEGYGRMDKVQIYKGTTRNVNVTFTMIATNEDDHAVMWYKINKLATVIYPQWTQGRKVEIGNLKFIQPFSQIPGATPVIRLRLGDLWKSNYSKMAVTRLFGATTFSDYNVEVPAPTQATPTPRTTTPAPSPEQQPAQPAQQTRRHARARNYNNLAVGDTVVLKYPTRGNNQNFDYYTENGTLINPGPDIYFKARLLRIGNQVNRTIPDPLPIEGLPPQNTSVTDRLFLFEIKTVHQPRTPNGSLGRGYRVVKAPQRTYQGGIPRGTDSNGIPLPSEGFNPKTNLYQSFFRTFLDTRRTNILLQIAADNQENSNQRQRASATPTGTQPTTTPTTQNTASNQSGGAVAAQAEGNTQATPPASSTPDMTAGLVTMTSQRFYDENQNPIIKSFKSSGGSGLAGVVTNFKIDLKGKDGTWGTNSSRGLKAPTMVNISLTLAVIHDIVPGLDSNGVMNAPIWPVGEHNDLFMNQGEREVQETEDPQIGYDSGRYYFNRNFIRRT